MTLTRPTLFLRCSHGVLFYALMLVAFTSQVQAQALQQQWARQFGSNRVDEAFAVATAPGSVYVAGETFGDFPDFTNAGNRDAFLGKFDTEGNLLWTVQFGTDVNDSASGVAADATGVYVTGFTNGALEGSNAGGADVFVRKYDVDGNLLWTRQFGGAADDWGHAAAVDATGVYVTGHVIGVLPGQSPDGLGGDDVFVRKYDLSGTELWTRQFGTTSGDRGYGVAVDNSGVYVAGATIGSLVGAGQGTDGFLRKYTQDGDVVWTRQTQNEGTDSAYAVAVGTTGVYIMGDTTGTFPGQAKIGGLTDAWARKYDLDGNEQWTRQYGTTSDEIYYGGIATHGRWVYVATYSGSWTFLLQRFDVDGADTGAFRTSADRNFAYAVAVDGSGAYLAGSKDGTSLGQTPLGDLDALLLKLPHPPELNYVSEAFTGTPGVAPSTWISVYGDNLSTTSRTWDDAVSGAQLPTSLDGVSVMINNRPATIYFISSGQVNVIAPLDETAGAVQVTLTNAYGTSFAFEADEGAVLPAFYAPFGDAQGLAVTAVAPDGTLVGKPGVDPRVTRPAHPGEVLQFFATGFGPTNPPVATDQLFMGAPELVVTPRITIGGQEAAVVGGKGFLVGPALFQINLTIPNLPNGDHPIVAEINGVQSKETVYLTVGE